MQVSPAYRPNRRLVGTVVVAFITIAVLAVAAFLWGNVLRADNPDALTESAAPASSSFYSDSLGAAASSSAQPFYGDSLGAAAANQAQAARPFYSDSLGVAALAGAAEQ